MRSAIPHLLQERVLLQPLGSEEWFEFDQGLPVGPAATALAFPQPQVRWWWRLWWWVYWVQGVAVGPAATALAFPQVRGGWAASTGLRVLRWTFDSGMRWTFDSGMRAPRAALPSLWCSLSAVCVHQLTCPVCNAPRAPWVQTAVPPVPREQPLGVQVKGGWCV